MLTKHYGGVVGHEIDKPAGTITAVDHHALTAAHLIKLKGTCRDGQRVDAPAPTVQAGGKHAGVVTAHLLHNTTGHSGGAADRPLHTVTTGNHAALVYSFLVKYYSEGGQWSSPAEPMHTIPTKQRMGLVTVEVGGEEYVIADIGMRMLEPRELYRAQSFPTGYVIDYGIDADGRRVKLTKTDQVRMCGNSVCPAMSEALVRANLAPENLDAEQLEAAA